MENTNQNFIDDNISKHLKPLYDTLSKWMSEENEQIREKHKSCIPNKMDYMKLFKA